jgi:3-deoxy-D-manno-octulosonic-acid transferase
MNLIYNLSIYFYSILIKFYSLFNPKARQWVEGRKIQQLPNLKDNKVIWMHCSSLGEFEQGKPVFEGLKKKLKNYTFVLTFFSPSGYKRLKNNHQTADYILYLPLDISGASKIFLNKINPYICIFVKYDFWLNYIKHINNRNIKLIYISVLFSKKHSIFNIFNRPVLNELKKAKIIFTQNIETFELLTEVGFSNVETVGDTRIDRVLEIASIEYSDEKIENFKSGNKKILICGSVWEKDIEIISEIKDSLCKSLKLIIAPHEISEKILNTLLSEFKKFNVQLYSDYNQTESGVLIIDRIGILSRIYRFGDIAYIGGGFGKGIHNTLEPGAYNLPVIFGPKYSRFIEADTLVRKNAYFSVKNSEELMNTLTFIDDYKNKIEIKNKIKSYFEHNRNASVKIIDYIYEFCS